MTNAANEYAQERVRRALALIERAQRDIEAAAQELCPIRGMGDDWAASHIVLYRLRGYHDRVSQRAAALRGKGGMVAVDPYGKPMEADRENCHAQT